MSIQSTLRKIEIRRAGCAALQKERDHEIFIVSKLESGCRRAGLGRLPPKRDIERVTGEPWQSGTLLYEVSTVSIQVLPKHWCVCVFNRHSLYSFLRYWIYICWPNVTSSPTDFFGVILFPVILFFVPKKLYDWKNNWKAPELFVQTYSIG